MPSPHVVATVMCPGSMTFEVSVAAEVFSREREGLGQGLYEWRLCALDDKPITTGSGFAIVTPYRIADIADADTVIVAPTEQRQYPEELLVALRDAHGRGARMVSLCSGAFVLAAAGLLDGRRATTHWFSADELARAHPSIEVDQAVLYVDEGDVLTSAGTAASIDLCLHLVRLDHGAEVANLIARRMVVPPHRDGGQAQFVDQPLATVSGDDLFAETLFWAEQHITEDLTVNSLAERTAMSPRTFARRFGAATGTTPHQWVTMQRVLLARRLLETTELSVERVAADSGLGSATNLRLHFQRILHATPTQYRSAFQLVRSGTSGL